ncbi:DUF7674 family protein [Piscinibacter terrae]|uniref:DUF7674 domain-containing protein n=1 Tax=Piscinibacter terrae TaxID=2496871 RepID=A0A3N7HSZ5_9BURK|nr:hypothetical protein [Albitalea terrae]RQP25420.1 hypothetical protein DZC73_11410 [Albitalea terrae]
MSADARNFADLQIVEAIRAAFPEDAEFIDSALGIEYENAHHTWVERFSQLTTDAIRRGEFTRAAEHLKLISALLARGDDSTLRCIDVAYVESLMWDIKDESTKREGWKLIPANLKSLYIGMWGEKPFMKGVK